MSADTTLDKPVSLNEIKLIIDEYLRNYFKTQVSQAGQVSQRYAKLWQSAEALVIKGGGKRLRPYMVSLAYKSFGGDNLERILPAAAAYELLHVAVLIHDDIIDRDDIRYGMANVSGQYLKEYAHLSPADQRHFANSAAILIGDALLAEAHRLLTLASDDLIRLRDAQLAFSTSLMHVIGGELIDTESSIRSNDDVDALKIARYKTASYSFVGPLTTGAHLAGADETSIVHLKEFATALGIAFQLKDDLLGSFGDESITGKSSNGDLKEGKRTYLVEQFDKLASKSDTSEFYELFGRDHLQQNQIDKLCQLLVDSGAVKAAEDTILRYTTQAQSALDQLKISNYYVQEYQALISKSVDRQK